MIFQHEGLIMVETNDCGKCARLQNAFTRPAIFFLPLAEYFMQSIHPIITAEAPTLAALASSHPRDSSTAGTGSFDVDTLGNVFFFLLCRMPTR